MVRGFAFTFDALLAIVVLGIFIVPLYFLSSQAKQDSFSQIVIKKQADDMLIVLDKGGDLATSNPTWIGNSISQAIPPTLAYNITVDYYTYSNNFTLSQSISAGTSYANASKLISSQREFVAFETRGIVYGVARLRLWVK